jgi:hypothetical protein
MKLGDQGIGISVDPSDNPISVCGPGYIDFIQDTVDGSVVQCDYTPDFGPNAGVSQEAQCFFSDVVCPCNKVGAACKNGILESVATCPTLINELNVAGCTGTLTVFDLNGTALREGESPSCTGTDGCAIEIGDGNELLTTVGKCQKVYPKALGFAKLVASKIIQQCTTGSVAKNPIVDYAARSTNNYESTAEYSNLFSATCNPEDGFPSNACFNDGGAWIAFSTAETGEQCSANNFTCGQLPDGKFGPPPSTCRVKSPGQCECRCDRCTPEGTLVNLGTGDQGLFVLASTGSDNAFACSVRVTGN